MTNVCTRCKREFDLMKYGFPGNPNRNVCWDCEPPHYAAPTPARMVVDDSYYDALDYAEGRCLGDDWD